MTRRVSAAVGRIDAKADNIVELSLGEARRPILDDVYWAVEGRLEFPGLSWSVIDAVNE